jgi:LysR family cys regulon transcriptional activator
MSYALLCAGLIRRRHHLNEDYLVTLQQMRIVRETIRRHFNLTEVAAALFTSQSGVSKHIKDLEGELGIDIFLRRGKRLLGLTDPGLELAPIIERIVVDAENVRSLSHQFVARDEGTLRIATTHTQARYALPEIISKFRTAYPKVRLALHECGPADVVVALRTGEADIGIATENVTEAEDLATYPFYSWQHVLVTPSDHPLNALETLTIDDIATYPIVTYEEGLTGRGRIDRAFMLRGHVPDIVVSARDADVIKAYVELGLGVGIIAAIAVSPESRLRARPVTGLSENNVTSIALKRGALLREYTVGFLKICLPDFDERKAKREFERMR